MSHLRTLVEANRDEIKALVGQHRGRSIALFGSVARGDDGPLSDIDFLVEFDARSSLFDLMNLEEALETLLGVSVDVVSAGGLKDRDEHILRDAVPL